MQSLSRSGFIGSRLLLLLLFFLRDFFMYLFVNIVNNVKNSNILYIFFQEVVLPTSSFSFLVVK